MRLFLLLLLLLSMKTKKIRSRRRTKPAVAFFPRDGAFLRSLLRHPERRRERFPPPPPTLGRDAPEKKRRRKSFTAARAKKKKSKIAPKPPLFSTRRRIVRNETTFAFWRSEIVRTCGAISRFLGDWMEPAVSEQKSRHLVESAFFLSSSERAKRPSAFFPFFFWCLCVCLSKTLQYAHKRKHVLTARLSLFPPSRSFVPKTHTTGSRHGPSRFRSHGNRTRRG